MSLDHRGTFTPMPGSAPFARQVVAQAGMEARLLLRNGEQLLLAVVIPVIVLVGAVTGATHVGLTFAHPAVDVFTPGVLALAVMSTSFASLAIATGFERRYGVIKRLGASPLPRHGLLLGKVLALLNVVALQLVSLVVGSGRGRDLPAIIDRLVERAAATKQRAVAEVRSAVPLTDDQQERLAAALANATGKQVELKVVVDPSVLGGLVATVGDTVIDGTVRSRLDQVKSLL